MKLKPFKGDTFKYWEDPEEHEYGYMYEVYTLADDRKSRVLIGKEGVSILFEDTGEVVDFDLVPNDIYPGDELTTFQIMKIVGYLNRIDCKGTVYSKEEWEAVSTLESRGIQKDGEGLPPPR